MRHQVLVLGMVLVAGMAVAQDVAVPVEIGSRLELFVDDALIESMNGASLVLHPPTPREVVLVHDERWEGNSCNYYAVFEDGGLYRMYYRGGEQVLNGEPPAHELTACYAVSVDGIHWVKPDLGLFEYEGSKHNNIIWIGDWAHDFTPFKDTNPACSPDARYKAVGAGNGGLMAFKSADGVRWEVFQEGPILTQGAFDSENLVFWDTLRGQYRVYFRDFRDGLRDIKTAVSTDFVNWSEPQWLEYPGAPREQLYTNQVIPYFRAPHIYLGFPTRYVERGWSPSTWALPEPEHRKLRAETSDREGMGLTDGLFMASRDGLTFHRWDRAFIAPGLRTADNWVYGDNYQGWGIVTTASSIENAPRELSVYASESYWTGTSSTLRRFTLRVDGFVSVQTAREGGEMVTKPLVFAGKELVLNFGTSAAGAIRIEIQDAQGTPIPGFALGDALEVFGDDLARVVPWKEGSDLSTLAGKPIKLRFVMNEADLYSIQFRE